MIKKAEVEQTVSVMDELVLELMEIVDGVKIGFWGKGEREPKKKKGGGGETL